MEASRKSTYMRMLERHYEQPIEEIVPRVCAKHATPEAAAAEMGISLTTLRKWRELFDAGEPAGVAA